MGTVKVVEIIHLLRVSGLVKRISTKQLVLTPVPGESITTDDVEEVISRSISGSMFASTSSSISSGGEAESRGYPQGKQDLHPFRNSEVPTGSTTTFHCL